MDQNPDKSDKTILHIIGQLGVGGAERQLYLLLEGLHDRFNFTVISYDEKRLDYMDAIQALGVKVIVIPKRPGLIGRLGFLRNLGNLIREIDPDIVHTWLRSANFWGRIACLLSKKKRRIIASVRNVGEIDKKILETLAERLLAKKIDVIITNTFAARNYMLSYKIPEKKIRVIHNGIDPELYDFSATKEEIRKQLSIPEHKALIGTIGRMMPQKNHVMFVEVAREILRKRNDVHFVLVGDGELRHNIEALISKYGLCELFTLTGQRDDIPQLLRAFDIFILTSLWEGLPNVIMEAMCARLPVVATDVGGVSELINHGENGFLVPPDDACAMFDAVNRLIDDEELRIKFGHAGRGKIEKRFSLDQICEATSRIYDELLHRSYS